MSGAGRASASPSQGSIRDVLGNGAFLRLWINEALTQIMHNMVNFALLLRVRDIVEIHHLPNANTAISLVIIAFSLPAVLFGPIAGVLADRFNKRLLMSVLNGGRALAVLLFLGIRPGWHVETILAAYYIVTFLFGIAGQFYAPVLGAMIPTVARREQLLAANSLFSLTSTSAQLIGFAAVGPVMIRLFGIDMVFLIAMIAYLFAAAFTFTLPETPVSQRTNVDELASHPIRRVWSDMKDGLVYILQDPALMRAIGYLTLASTTFLMVATLGPDFVTTVIGLSKEDIGYIVAPAGGGIVAGVLIVPRLIRRVGRDWLIDISLTFAGIMMALMAVVRSAIDWFIPGPIPLNLVVVLAACFAAGLGLCNAFILVPSQTMLQERSHEGVRARVYATFFTISNTVAFVPIFFAAAAADIFGVQNVLLVMAACIGLLGFFGLFHRRAEELRRWERVRTRHGLGPDAIPERGKQTRRIA